MITMQHTAPHPLLAPFVRQYELVNFDTGDYEFVKPWHASSDTYLTFFLEDKPLCMKNEQTGYYVSGAQDAGLVGLATHFVGNMHFRGKYRCFQIEFTPNGLAFLFRLPAVEMVNQIHAADGLFGSRIKELLEQLYHARSVTAMAFCTDRFLLRICTSQKHNAAAEGIASIVRKLLASGALFSVPEYARLANMSVRNFERRFREQVGVSLKFYTKLLRFQQAMNAKVFHPDKGWTDIAHECNYFDQAHMLKDFRQFAGTGPRDLFRSVPPPQYRSVFVPRTVK